MSIRFKVGGNVSVECDTREEAEFLLDRMLQVASGNTPDKKSPPTVVAEKKDVEDKQDEPRKFHKWWAKLSEPQQKAMELLKQSIGGVSTDEMSNLLGIERDQLKYAMRSIRSAAVAVGLHPDLVVESNQVRVNGTNVSQYTMSSQARESLNGV